jgi:hypothetical protein
MRETTAVPFPPVGGIIFCAVRAKKLYAEALVSSV